MIKPSSVEHFHLLFVLISLLTVVFSLVFSSLYLIQQWRLKAKKNLTIADHLPSLEALDQYVIRSLILGFVSLSILLFSGILLAHLVWKNDWIHDEKFIVAICTWLWFAITLVLRFRMGIRGDKFFYTIFVGFILLVASCMMAWMGMP